jgi:hypothetical protein
MFSDLVIRGELDVLLVSPERLNNPEFRENVLPALAADAGLVVGWARADAGGGAGDGGERRAARGDGGGSGAAV